MATWDDLDKQSESEKEEVEEEANLALVATIASDAESRIDSDDEDDVYSKLTRSELIETVKDLISHYQRKSKDLKVLKTKFDLLVRDNDRNNLLINDLEEENKYIKKMTDKWSNKPLSEQNFALHEEP